MSRSRIVEIEGIGAAYGKKLVDAGIKTTDDLLEAGSSEMKR
jgi:predicted flap endonuclease-1-like 5' DNA nuclease